MTVWILISTYKGIISEPKIFYNRAKAIQTKNKIIKKINLDYEEIELFKKRIFLKRKN